MAMVIRMVIMLLIMNLCLYVGTALITSQPDSDGVVNPINKDLQFHFNDDLLSTYFGGREKLDALMNDTKLNYTSYDVNFSGDWNQIPNAQTGGIGGLTTFIDSLNTVYAFIKTIGNIVMSPLTLFFNYRVPVLIGILVGFPYVLMLVMGLIWFIRGMPS